MFVDDVDVSFSSEFSKFSLSELVRKRRETMTFFKKTTIDKNVITLIKNVKSTLIYVENVLDVSKNVSFSTRNDTKRQQTRIRVRITVLFTVQST